MIKKALLFLIVSLSAVSAETSAFAGSWAIPDPVAPIEYGNIVIDRATARSEKFKPVLFSHWSHRRFYTCRVCHTELGFEMRKNSTEITEDSNKSGRYCGACHDGVAAFGHTPENCDKCHGIEAKSLSEKFAKLKDFPKVRYGNGVNWVTVLNSAMIKPKQYLKFELPSQEVFKKTLTTDPEWANFAPAVFPHESHNSWVDCSSCHPDIFNIKQKTTKHFAMTLITEGKFCGVCHLSVAFPLNNCRRCHPAMGK